MIFSSIYLGHYAEVSHCNFEESLQIPLEVHVRAFQISNVYLMTLSRIILICFDHIKKPR